jgi:hypothetical protein
MNKNHKTENVWSVLDSSTLLHRLAIKVVELLRESELKKSKEKK